MLNEKAGFSILSEFRVEIFLKKGVSWPILKPP